MAIGAATRALGLLAKNPVVRTAGGLGATGLFLAEPAVNAAESVADVFTGASFSEAVDTALSDRNLAPSRPTLRAQRLQGLMQENEAMLAMQQPHLYAELLAGRRLPRGAVMFGGGGHRGIMEEVAFRMGAGQFRPSGAVGAPRVDQRAILEAILSDPGSENRDIFRAQTGLRGLDALELTRARVDLQRQKLEQSSRSDIL